MVLPTYLLQVSLIAVLVVVLLSLIRLVGKAETKRTRLLRNIEAYAFLARFNRQNWSPGLTDFNDPEYQRFREEIPSLRVIEGRVAKDMKPVVRRLFDLYADGNWTSAERHEARSLEDKMRMRAMEELEKSVALFNQEFPSMPILPSSLDVVKCIGPINSGLPWRNQAHHELAREPRYVSIPTVFRCPLCRHYVIWVNANSSYYCPNCQTYPWRCNICGMSLSRKYKVCEGCGAPLKKQAPALRATRQKPLC